MQNLREIAGILKEKNDFLIASHVRPDGDSIGSQLAMGLILERLGKRFEIINPDTPQKRFDFLPLFKKIKTSFNEEPLFSVSIILDCGKWSRIGEVERIARKSPVIVNIDNHKDSSCIGNFNYITSGVSSTGEIIFSLLPLVGLEPDKEIATALYVAILTDTGRFRYSNTGPETHRVAARLLETGISSEYIAGNIMAQETPASLKIYSEIRNTLSTSNKIAWYSVSSLIQEKITSGKIEIESDRLFDELRTLKGYDIFILFTHMGERKIRASFRANSGIDLSSVAGFFGGGGHPQACSCIIEGNLLQVQEVVIEKVQEKNLL